MNMLDRLITFGVAGSYRQVVACLKNVKRKIYLRLYS